jgi:hypothetical protein
MTIRTQQKLEKNSSLMFEENASGYCDRKPTSCKPEPDGAAGPRKTRGKACSVVKTAPASAKKPLIRIKNNR